MLLPFVATAVFYLSTGTYLLAAIICVIFVDWNLTPKPQNPMMFKCVYICILVLVLFIGQLLMNIACSEFNSNRVQGFIRHLF